MLPVGKRYERRRELTAMQTANSIIVRPQRQERHFALCEVCFWSATIIAKAQISCPFCPAGSVALIPLANNEQYRIKLAPSGLELAFSKA